MKTIFIIGVGGMAGTMLRYLLVSFFSKHFPFSIIPFGTLLVNFLGCLLIGIIYGLSERFQLLTPQWRLFLATGVCGGFTTFSAFALENISMLQQSNYSGFALYSLSSFVLCLVAVFAGLSIIKMI